VVNNELLSVVLDVSSGWFIDNITISGSQVIIDYGKHDGDFDKDVFNIYELTHKCKEWALSNVEQLVWDSNTTSLYLNKFSCDITSEGGFYYDTKFEATTELEAIFKACEWILQQTDQKENK